MGRNRSQSLNFDAHKSAVDQRRSKESITELKHVYTSIKYDWPQCLEDNANPIEMAITLLDDTSVGLAHKKHEFERLSQDTTQALRYVVNENHEIFNNSIGSYHLLVSTLQDSQNDAIQIKDMLETSTKDIHSRSDVLGELDHLSLRYAEMIEILDAMDELNGIPETIEQLIADKKVHQVYDVISGAYATAEKYNLWSLSAMGSVQSYLEQQSNNLYDMIVDELQNEIYLKNNSLEDNDGTRLAFSWQSLLQSSNPQLSSFKTLLSLSGNLEQYIYNAANLDIYDIADCLCEAAGTFIAKQLPRAHAHYSDEAGVDYEVLLDGNLDPSAQLFHYIYMLLLTASKLNKTNQVLEVLLGTNQQELHGLISRTTEEIKSKNILLLTKLNKLHNFEYSTSIDIIGGNTFNDSSVVILQDLFGSIFIKFLLVLQKHKIVQTIIELLESSQKLSGAPVPSNRNSYSKEGVYDIYAIWKVMKKELQSLMLNYTYDESVANPSSSKVIQHNNLHEVLLKKELFKFEDVSYSKSAKTTEDMKHVLTNMFPGFELSDNGDGKSNQIEFASPYLQNENFNALVEVLVPKNIFNMRIILEFFLIFIAGSQRIFLNFAPESLDIRPSSSVSLQFFLAFMNNSFLSRLSETLDKSFKEYVEDKDDAASGLVTENNNERAGGSQQLFSTGLKSALVSMDTVTIIHQSFNTFSSSTTNSAAKIYQNAIDFKRIFLNACSTLNTSLTYRQEISDLVLKFLKKFSNAYNSFYKELLSHGDSSSLGAPSKPSLTLHKWIGSSALTEMSGLILQQTNNSEDLEPLINKEVEIMLYNSQSRTQIFETSKDDFLDNDSFNQVTYLFLTASWILGWLPSMKKESNYTIYNESTDNVKLSTIDKLKFDWSFLENGRSNYTASEETQHIYLALNSSKINEFNDIINNFETIRDETLLALRYDLRARAIYFLGKSAKETDWLPTTEPGDADQFISQYNKEIFSVDNKLGFVLNDLEREGVFVGLPNFINQLLIQGSENIQKINNNGIKRIMLNIFTLQQMFKSILKNPERIDFSKSSRYFELFTLKDLEVLSDIKTNKYGFNKLEYLNLARLMYSEKLADGGSSFNKSKYNDLVKKITESFWKRSWSTEYY